MKFKKGDLVKISKKGRWEGIVGIVVSTSDNTYRNKSYFLRIIDAPWPWKKKDNSYIDYEGKWRENFVFTHPTINHIPPHWKLRNLTWLETQRILDV